MYYISFREFQRNSRLMSCEDFHALLARVTTRRARKITPPPESVLRERVMQTREASLLLCFLLLSPER